LSSASVKAQLGSALGSNGLPYWRSLSDFLNGKASRSEFEKIVRAWIDTPDLVHLHNTLLMSMITTARGDPIFNPASASATSNGKSTGGPNGSSAPARKKRRILPPHQDPSPKLKKWVMGIKKAERERIKGLLSSGYSPQPLWKDDEVGLERSIMLRAEGKNPAGTRVPLSLSTMTRTLPSQQNLAERISLIASQHNLTTSRPVASLATAAIEAYLKQITMHALTLTSSSHPFTSITPASANTGSSTFPHSGSNIQHPSTLSVSSFISLFTVVPSSNPGPSAAIDRLFLEGGRLDGLDADRRDGRQDVEDALDAGLDEGLAQYWGLISARSGVRDFLRENL